MALIIQCGGMDCKGIFKRQESEERQKWQEGNNYKNLSAFSAI
jgi:hypothetical protein